MPAPRILPPLFVFANLAAACAVEPAPMQTSVEFPDAPTATVSSSSGALTADVRTAPSQPPTRGVSSVRMTLKRSDGTPITGAALTVVPWMPAMGHGTSVVPTVTEEGDGSYRVDDVDMFMPGVWELRTTVSGATEDQVVPSFQIP